MLRRLMIVWAVCLIAAAGCSTSNPVPEALATRPADFSIDYHWREGSLPPPYHYQYSVSLTADGQGEVVMIPDYPADDVPRWTESFELSPAELDELYQALLDQGLFTEEWRAQDDAPMGGSSQSLSITAHGREVSIPSYVISEQQAAAGEIYDMITALVPEPIWDRLNAQREAYIQEQE